MSYKNIKLYLKRDFKTMEKNYEKSSHLTLTLYLTRLY